VRYNVRMTTTVNKIAVGWHVARWTAKLEARLRSKLTGRYYTTVNSGQPLYQWAVVPGVIWATH
jgi:hypothetical protein